MRDVVPPNTIPLSVKLSFEPVHVRFKVTFSIIQFSPIVIMSADVVTFKTINVCFRVVPPIVIPFGNVIPDDNVYVPG